MVELLPRAIILDMREPYQQFMQQAEPYLLGTEKRPEEIVEDLWEAMFDADTVDERLLDTICEIGNKAVFQNASRPVRFFDVVHDFAQHLYERIDKHKLYGDRGYIPFNMEVRQQGLLVLKLDDHLDKVQQELDTDEDITGVENLDDLEYM